MIYFKRKLKNFGPLEVLVISSFLYVFIMLTWTASTRSQVIKKASDIQTNHKVVVEFINDEVNKCSSDIEASTSWGENCNSVWTSSKIVKYILDNFKLNNPYNIKKPLIQISQDPRIRAEGKAGPTLAHCAAHLEDGQVHRNHHAADHNPKEGHDDGLDHAG